MAYEPRIRCHRVWINGHVIGVTPSSISLKNANKNEEIQMGDDSFITVSNRDGAFEYSFDFLVPLHRPANKDLYPYENPDSGGSAIPPNHNAWKDFFWNLKNKSERFEPIEFVIERTDGYNTVENMLLKDYSCVEDADNDDAFTFSVTFMEYRMAMNQELNTYVEHHLIRAGQARGWKSGRGRMGDPDYIRKLQEEEEAAKKALQPLNADQEAQARLLDELAQDEYAQMVQDGRIPEWYLPIADRVKRRVHATDPWSPEYPDPFPEGGVDIPTIG